MLGCILSTAEHRKEFFSRTVGTVEEVCSGIMGSGTVLKNNRECLLRCFLVH